MTCIAHSLNASTKPGFSLGQNPFRGMRRWAGALSAGCVAFAMAVLGTSQVQGQTFSTPGNTTWTCPAGVTSVQVQAWGGGGGSGGAGASFASTGGGAGGSYVEVTSVAVTPGTI